LLEQVSARPGPRHFGEPVQESSEAQAERWVVEGLKRLGCTEGVLRAKRKGDASKVALARELRSRTTMPLAQVRQPPGPADELGLNLLAWRLAGIEPSRPGLPYRRRERLRGIPELLPGFKTLAPVGDLMREIHAKCVRVTHGGMIDKGAKD